MYFELITLAFAAIVYLFLKRTDKNIGRNYIATFIGVFIFEFFTHPLWINKVEPWAYIPIPNSPQIDISWVITLGWTTIVLLAIKIVDSLYPKANERTRFLGYLGIVTVFGVIAEYFVRLIGVREYDTAVYEALTGKTIGGILPIEVFYYIPVFMTLVIAFSKYWSISANSSSQVKSKAKTSKILRREK